jgi:hypothetical protein
MKLRTLIKVSNNMLEGRNKILAVAECYQAGNLICQMHPSIPVPLIDGVQTLPPCVVCGSTAVKVRDNLKIDRVRNDWKGE